MDPEEIAHRLQDLGGEKIRFIILFGSVAQGTATPLSDVDIAVYYDGTSEERFRFRVQAAGELPDKVDIQIFQDLPLPVQKEVLGGKLLFTDNYEFLVATAMDVVKEFSSFEKYYEEYLSALAAEAA